MKSKTLIEKQIKKKTNKPVVKTILLAKKNPSWNAVASILVGSNRKSRTFNLLDIDKASEGNLTLIVPGKVLSNGEVSKKFKIAAISYSEKAKEKLLKAGCDVLLLEEVMEKNKTGKDIKILK